MVHWIPAYAGMTKKNAGMTERDAGMTEKIENFVGNWELDIGNYLDSTILSNSQFLISNIQ